jgi:hypothetical protein
MNFGTTSQQYGLQKGFLLQIGGFETILHLQWLNSTNIALFVDRKLKFQNHSHLQLHVQRRRHAD